MTAQKKQQEQKTGAAIIGQLSIDISQFSFRRFNERIY